MGAWTGWARGLCLVALLLAHLTPVQAALAASGGWFAFEIDPRATLTRAERQAVQQALVWVGSYKGGKSGEWDAAADQALLAWQSASGLPVGAVLSRAELAALMAQAARARSEAGWVAGKDPNAGFWFGWPSRFAGLPVAYKDEDSYGSDYEAVGADAVTLRTRVTKADPRAFIAELMAGGPGRLLGRTRVTFRLDRPERQVLMLLTGSNGVIYLRYEKVGEEWRGFMASGRNGSPGLWIIAPINAEFSGGASSPAAVLDAADAPILTEVLASAGGFAPDQVSPEAGRNGRGQGARPAVPTGAASGGTAPGSGLRPSSSGTAFVVGREGVLLTNAHVIAGCGGLKLADGTAVSVVAADPKRDLALVHASHPFPSALSLRRNEAVELGETVHVFGFPYFHLVSESLNVTDGIVTSQSGLRGNAAQFQMSASLQPGNSGGPVLDAGGNVIGVSVAVLNSLAVAAATGTLPQGMNYAVRGEEVEAFLQENEALGATKATTRSRDLREIAREAKQLVFPLICFR